MKENRLAVQLPGLDLKNPIMPASGTFGFGDVKAARAFDLNELGALVIKTATREAQAGNPQPQIWVGDQEVINSVGLTNPGVDAVVADKLPALRAAYPDLPVIGSVGGSTEDDYQYVARTLSESGLINALELNISCPNVHEGGAAFGTNPEVAARLTREVKAQTKLPVYVKLTPGVTDIVAIAQAVAEAGADGLTLINTLLGMRIDVESRQPVVGNVMGGLSGKPLHPLAVRMIYQVSRAVDIPIIGVGGISSADDVIEMFLAGASAVQVGTAHFYNERICPDLVQALPARMDELGIDSLESLRQEIRAQA